MGSSPIWVVPQSFCSAALRCARGSPGLPRRLRLGVKPDYYRIPPEPKTLLTAPPSAGTGGREAPKGAQRLGAAMAAPLSSALSGGNPPVPSRSRSLLLHPLRYTRGPSPGPPRHGGAVVRCLGRGSPRVCGGARGCRAAAGGPGAEGLRSCEAGALLLLIYLLKSPFRKAPAPRMLCVLDSDAIVSREAKACGGRRVGRLCGEVKPIPVCCCCGRNAGETACGATDAARASQGLFGEAVAINYAEVPNLSKNRESCSEHFLPFHCRYHTC